MATLPIEGQSSTFDRKQFDDLSSLLNATRGGTRVLNDYYEGIHRLEQLGLAIPPELRKFMVFLNWPRVVVDAIEQRLDVQGFRMPGGSADRSLWDVWQYNNMDERQSFAHTDALALGRSYICVGTNDEDPEYPIITVESPEQMVAVRDPRTHKVIAALRSYDPDGGLDKRRTLYLPNETRWLIRDGSTWADERDPDVHNLGTVPVVPMVNRNRATRRSDAILEGVSEMADIIPIADSASRAITNVQLVQETLAVPQRYILGATKGDFVDGDGNPLSVWESYFGGILAAANAGGKAGQFDAAEISNFENAMNMYARNASGVSGLPIEYFGPNTQNAPSAEGQRAGETRLIKRAERRQVPFGHAWESVQRLVMRFRDGEWDSDARRMETIWRDAGTPTVAQVTDAIVKRYQTGLIDWETAQERMGESPAAIEQMRERRTTEQDTARQFGVDGVV